VFGVNANPPEARTDAGQQRDDQRLAGGSAVPFDLLIRATYVRRLNVAAPTIRPTTLVMAQSGRRRSGRVRGLRAIPWFA
jgi:hypothetical protein